MKSFKRFNIVIVATVLLFSALLVPLPMTASTKAYRQGQIIVKFKNGISDQAASKALSDSGARGRGRVSSLKADITEVPKGREEAMVAQLSKNPAVEYAEVDSLFFGESLDTYYTNQYGLENKGQTIKGNPGVFDADIDAPEAWVKSKGTGVKVAVLDTGIDQDHEDLKGKIVLQKNFTVSKTVDDIYGHGTHVAGIIAAQKDNSLGVAGVCPGCVLLNGKVLGDNNYGYLSDVASGIMWAADNGAKVINMSLGSTIPSQTLSDAIDYAWSKGSVIVAAAGNNGSKDPFYPAAYTKVIAVAATDNRDVKASFSNYGSTWVDVAAPGLNIYSTVPNHLYFLGLVNKGFNYNYEYLSGTSMASPAVAGTAALVWKTKFGTSNKNVRYRIENRTDRIAGTGTNWAYGRVNANLAVTAP